MNYFNATKETRSEIERRREAGVQIPIEDDKFSREAYKQMEIQGILAMSEEEVSTIKSQFCDFLEREQKKYPEEKISALAGLYSALSPEEFKASMLRPSVLGELRKYSFKAGYYITVGPEHSVLGEERPDFAYGMTYDYSEVDIEGGNLEPEALQIIKNDAEQRAEDVKEKLESGMTLYKAVKSDVGYRESAPTR